MNQVMIMGVMTQGYLIFQIDTLINQKEVQVFIPTNLCVDMIRVIMPAPYCREQINNYLNSMDVPPNIKNKKNKNYNYETMGFVRRFVDLSLNATSGDVDQVAIEDEEGDSGDENDGEGETAGEGNADTPDEEIEEDNVSMGIPPIG
jgi:hypothetical protein